MKPKHLWTGLTLGALWGLLTMVTFVTVGMTLSNEDHPHHWIFLAFRNAEPTPWFRIIFLPFWLLCAPSSPISIGAAAIFISTPMGALIGLTIGTMTSLLNYLTHKGEPSKISKNPRAKVALSLHNVN